MASLRETLDEAARVPDPSSTVPMARHNAVVSLTDRDDDEGEEPVSPVGSSRQAAPAVAPTSSVPWVAVGVVLAGLVLGGLGVFVIGLIVGLLAVL